MKSETKETLQMTPQKYNGSEMTTMNNYMPTKWIT